MRKELLIATFLGITIGVLIAFGAWRANRAINTRTKVKTLDLQKKPENTSPKPSEFKIVLSDPEENDVITSTPFKFSGITKATSTIVISSEEKDYILESDSEGVFNQEVELTAGVNQVLVAAFDNLGNKNEILRTVVFSSDFAKEFTNVQEGKATSEAETIREVVRQKLELSRKNPKAYIGTVTDKSQESLQIKNAQGEIKLASIDPETSFVKISQKKTNIAFQDIGIGDFVVVMGFFANNTSSPNKNTTNEVLNAKKVLVNEPTNPTKRAIILGEIISIQKPKMTIKEAGAKQWQLIFPKRWVGPEIKELSQGDKLIAIGEAQDDSLNIRTIHLVKPIDNPSLTPTPSKATNP